MGGENLRLLRQQLRAGLLASGSSAYPALILSAVLWFVTPCIGAVLP